MLNRMKCVFDNKRNERNKKRTVPYVVCSVSAIGRVCVYLLSWVLFACTLTGKKYWTTKIVRTSINIHYLFTVIILFDGLYIYKCMRTYIHACSCLQCVSVWKAWKISEWIKIVINDYVLFYIFLSMYTVQFYALSQLVQWFLECFVVVSVW